MEDRQLVDRVKNGDCQAFEALVLKYQQRVYNLCLHMTGNEQDAFDLSQESFLKAWKGLAGFAFESSFSTWLYRLTSNACLDFLRAQKRRHASSFSVQDDNGAVSQIQVADSAPSPEQIVLAAEERQILRDALLSLDVHSREIITLRVIDNLSYIQIARILGVQEGTVKSRLSRAREKLRKAQQVIGNTPTTSSSIISGKEASVWNAAKP